MRSIKGLFLFLFLLFPLESQELKGFDPKFHGWYWENFKLKPVPENVLKETFIGFSPDIDLGDFIFYEAVRDFGKNGHCLGTVLSAAIIFKENGLRGFCKPIYLYGTPDTNSSFWRDTLVPLIQMLHFRQFGKEFVEYVFEVLNFDPVNFVDGSKAYLAVERILSEKKVPLITIFKGPFESDGHALLAYKLEDNGVQKRIYVYDPNRPYNDNRTWYDNKENFIKIDGDNWEFVFSGGDTWSNGIIIVYPADILTFPQEHMGDMIEDLMTIVVAKADISQVEDGKGNKLFKRDIEGKPKLEDFERESKIKGFIKFPYVGVKDMFDKEIYIVKKGLFESLKIKLRDKGKGYTFEIFFPNNALKIESDMGSKGKDLIILKNLGSDIREIEIKNSTKSKSKYELKVYSLIEKDISKTVEIKNLDLEKDKKVIFSFSGNGKYFSFSSNKDLILDIKLYGKEKRVEIKDNKKLDLIYKTDMKNFIIKERIKESLK